MSCAYVMCHVSDITCRVSCVVCAVCVECIVYRVSCVCASSAVMYTEALKHNPTLHVRPPPVPPARASPTRPSHLKVSKTTRVSNKNCDMPTLY